MNKVLNKIMRTIAIFSWSRTLALWLIKLKPKKTLPVIINKDIVFEANSIVETIKRKGFSDLVSIDNERLNAIIDYSNKADYIDLSNDKTYKINYSNPIKPSDSLWYTSYNAEQFKEINEIVYDASILSIAKQYLGVEPTIKEAIMWWSFPPEDQNYNPLYGFHYDIDALKFLKLFIYITDVDEDSGPHVIISKTHLKKSFFEKRNRRLTDDQVSDVFETERINVMTAPKGTGFFEDTFAYHKGTTPKKPRLILQIEYSV